EMELLKLSDDDDLEKSEERCGEDFDTPNPENLNIVDVILIKFDKKTFVVHYVAKVISKYSVTEYQVLYLRKYPRS
ncbi:hypothetical protein HHI36_013494, partial [Cryptolaemus montrouzieri]